MPLSEFFAEQFRQIKQFMLDPSEVVRVVRIDPDLRYVLIKALVKMDDEPDNPHAMLFADTAFMTPNDYFTALLAQLQRNYEENAARLKARGTRFAAPYGDPTELHSAAQFLLYASTLADALPDSMGSLVFLLDPVDVKDPGSFRQTIEFLAGRIESRWLKFIVLDPRLEPRLDGLEQLDRIGSQTFYMAPGDIENKLREDAEKPAADPVQHRRTLGVLAGFAFGNKRYDEAARLQAEWASLAESGGAPAEAASACYNLGNTLLEKGDLSAAEEQYLKCCQLCMEHSVNGVLPLALTNLGVTLFREKRVEEGLASLRVAYQNFRAQNHKPGMAFVFDTLAAVYHAERQDDEAERAWLSALDVYKGITSDAFADLRKSGCDDISVKLERFYQTTGRPNRLSEQRERG